MNEQLNEQQFNKQIGKKILFFREKEKLTQNELAKLVRTRQAKTSFGSGISTFRHFKF